MSKYLETLDSASRKYSLDILKDAEKLLIGRDARLNLPRSKFNGRKGKVTNVMLGRDGEILSLLYIYNLKDGTFLNSKPDTRSYWPINNLIFEG